MTNGTFSSWEEARRSATLRVEYTLDLVDALLCGYSRVVSKNYTAIVAGIRRVDQARLGVLDFTAVAQGFDTWVIFWNKLLERFRDEEEIERMLAEFSQEWVAQVPSPSAVADEGSAAAAAAKAAPAVEEVEKENWKSISDIRAMMAYGCETETGGACGPIIKQFMVELEAFMLRTLITNTKSTRHGDFVLIPDRQLDVVCLDINHYSKNLTARKLCSTLLLNFAGPIVQLPGKEGTSLHVCTCFGQDFFMTPGSTMTMDDEAFIPAWMVQIFKPVKSKTAKNLVCDSTMELQSVTVPFHFEWWLFLQKHTITVEVKCWRLVPNAQYIDQENVIMTRHAFPQLTSQQRPPMEKAKRGSGNGAADKGSIKMLWKKCAYLGR